MGWAGRRADTTVSSTARSGNILVTDLTRIGQAGKIRLPPDGSRALYTITSVEETDQPFEYDYQTHLYLTGTRPGNVPKARKAPGSQTGHPMGSRWCFRGR